MVSSNAAYIHVPLHTRHHAFESQTKATIRPYLTFLWCQRHSVFFGDEVVSDDASVVDSHRPQLELHRASVGDALVPCTEYQLDVAVIIAVALTTESHVLDLALVVQLVKGGAGDVGAVGVAQVRVLTEHKTVIFHVFYSCH